MDSGLWIPNTKEAVKREAAIDGATEVLGRRRMDCWFLMQKRRPNGREGVVRGVCGILVVGANCDRSGRAGNNPGQGHRGRRGVTGGGEGVAPGCGVQKFRAVSGSSCCP